MRLIVIFLLIFIDFIKCVLYTLDKCLLAIYRSYRDVAQFDSADEKVSGGQFRGEVAPCSGRGGRKHFNLSQSIDYRVF